MKFEGEPGEFVHPLWLGLRGPMTGWGIRLTMKRRAREAGLDAGIYPHLFRP